ncbi:MAG: methyltransferase [Actinomycetota bacterium]|nr:methyltransferase [Actinomycetota bacterium]
MTQEVMPFGPVAIAFDETVLRPRPWTLAQSAWAAELAGGGDMLELGSGAGHIGLAAAALSGSRLVQVDRDPAACRWSAHNAVANGLAERVEQRCGRTTDVLDPGERFAVVIADPPYVPSADVGLYPDDPLGAIDGGPDGLDGVRAFLHGLDAHLTPGGGVVLQVRGGAQAARLSDPRFAAVEVRTYGQLRALVLLRSAE